MKRIGNTLPIVAATLLLAGCGFTDGVALEGVKLGERGNFAMQDEGSLPDWHPPLPPGHPPVTLGPNERPPGHPRVPEALGTCPAGGLLREPDIDRHRDFKEDPREVISI